MTKVWLYGHISVVNFEWDATKELENEKKHGVNFTEARAAYTRHYMLWSPVVKDAGEEAKENQIAFVKEIQDQIRMAFAVEIESVINQDFQYRLSELREYAGRQTEELKSPVLRYLQIEQYLTSQNSGTPRDAYDIPATRKFSKPSASSSARCRIQPRNWPTTP